MRPERRSKKYTESINGKPRCPGAANDQGGAEDGVETKNSVETTTIPSIKALLSNAYQPTYPCPQRLEWRI
jgi:hypothetical protein